MRTVLLVLCITLAGVPTVSASKRHYETMSGWIVAYSRGLTCINGNASWSMLIRVQRPKDKSPEFVQVPLSVPCDAPAPMWLPEKPELTRFGRLFRMKSHDAVLQEYIPLIDTATGKPSQAMPIWRYAPGMENEKLPFGQVVPYYGWDPVQPLL